MKLVLYLLLLHNYVFSTGINPHMDINGDYISNGQSHLEIHNNKIYFVSGDSRLSYQLQSNNQEPFFYEVDPYTPLEYQEKIAHDFIENDDQINSFKNITDNNSELLAMYEDYLKFTNVQGSQGQTLVQVNSEQIDKWMTTYMHLSKTHVEADKMIRMVEEYQQILISLKEDQIVQPIQWYGFFDAIRINYQDERIIILKEFSGL